LAKLATTSIGRKVVDTTDKPQASTVVDLNVALDLDTPADSFTLVFGNVGSFKPARDDETKIELGYADNGGFKQVMTGLESERINVAARGLGVARASFEEAIKYSQERRTFGKAICEHQAIQLKLADMATKIEASRLLVYAAAEKKDRGERCDLEAGMAKLFATETAQECSLEAMRIFGGNGYAKDFPVERYYRDAPLLIIGGGTNELQRLVIARGLLKKYSTNKS